MSFRRRSFPSCCEFLESRCLLSGATLNTNLVVNGDAEAEEGAGDNVTAIFPTGWTRKVPEGTVFPVNTGFSVVNYGASGGLPDSMTPGPADRGNNFFAGGPDNAADSIYQIIDVSNLAAGIDAGLIKVNLSGWLGGFGSDDDQMELSMFFLNSDPSDEGSQFFAGTVTAADRGNVTEFLQHSVHTTVPKGTRRIAVELDATRAAGTYDDAYADDVSLVLSSTATKGFVGGTIFNDINGNGVRDNTSSGNEPGVRGVAVFIDKNNNGKLDSGELHTTTNAYGHYLFSNVPAGKAIVRVVDPSGFRDTGPDPLHPRNPRAVMVQGGATSAANFSISQSMLITGIVYSDNLPANGLIDSKDDPIPLVVVYLDLNGNGKLDKTEPRVRTDMNGFYSFVVTYESGRFVLHNGTSTIIVTNALSIRAVAPKDTFLVPPVAFTQSVPKSSWLVSLRKGGKSINNNFLFEPPKE